MKVTPRSIAALRALTDSSSACGPHPPPIAQAPKPMSEIFTLVLPKVREFIPSCSVDYSGSFLSLLTVCIAAMSNCGDVDNSFRIIDCKDHSPVTDANSPVVLASSEFYASSGAWIFCELLDRSQNTTRNRRVELIQLSTRRSRERNAVFRHSPWKSDVSFVCALAPKIRAVDLCEMQLANGRRCLPTRGGVCEDPKLRPSCCRRHRLENSRLSF